MLPVFFMLFFCQAVLQNDISRSVLERASVLIASLHTSTSFLADYIRSFVQVCAVALDVLCFALQTVELCSRV